MGDTLESIKTSNAVVKFCNVNPGYVLRMTPSYWSHKDPTRDPYGNNACVLFSQNSSSSLRMRHDSP